MLAGLGRAIVEAVLVRCTTSPVIATRVEAEGRLQRLLSLVGGVVAGVG